MEAYTNLMEQAILVPNGANASCSPHGLGLFTSRGKDHPAGGIIANRVPGSLSSFKIAADPISKLLEASTNLSPSLRIAPPAGDTSAGNGRESKRWT
jgi:hypothetical protein